ncbi:hypothetical protein BVX94_00100 [bacterium B17]|nr:hypothetical protein BVX94_00100 [bacterium B17]
MNKHISPRFKTAGEALDRLGRDFNDWSEILTTRSIQAAYALIAANWAVHSSVDAILQNIWAKRSLVSVFVFLGLNLVLSYFITGSLYRQYYRAESNLDAWEKEYEKSNKQPSAWPYTKTSEILGAALRAIKVWMVVLATLFFLVSLFYDAPFFEIIKNIKRETGVSP